MKRSILPRLPSGPGARARRATLALVLVAALGVGLAAVARAAEGSSRTDWPDAAVDALGGVPVQAEGRIKPFDTWARFQLLGMNHRRKLTLPDDENIGATAWALDALLRPERATGYECLMVENADVLTAIGLDEAIKKKRARYSYDEIAPARERLYQLGSRYEQIDEKARDVIQAGVVKLFHEFLQLELTLHYLDFVRSTYDVPDVPEVRALFDGRAQVQAADVLARLPDLVQMARAGGMPSDPHAAADTPAGARAALGLLEAFHRLVSDARLLSILPPDAPVSQAEEWFSPLDLFQVGATTGQVSPSHLAVVERLQELVATRDDPVRFVESSEALRDSIVALADARGEMKGIGLERAFYRLAPFGWAFGLYFVAFLLVAVTWLRPQWRWLVMGAVGLLLAGAAFHVTGIVIRSILRGRPPVSTLYDTVVFITAFCVLAALVVERMNRQRIALALAPVLGVLGLFVAGKYEIVTGEDTLPRLVAVLDTNFWLATHVTCITIGYAAGLLAAAIAHLYVLGKAFGLKSNDPAWYATVGRMVYGTLGFALIFSVVGTILGGVWANESWGRFWGWDPKENGALMIVLAQLAVLHARLGGYLRPFGISMATIAQGGVVAFSWWGVNLLGIGLHSYGFASGVWTGLKIFYAVELAVLLTGGVWWLRARMAARHGPGATA